VSDLHPATAPKGLPFGRYLIRRRLARGGMGEVLLADQLGPTGPVRPVALKRVLPGLARDARTANLFLREMATAAQLHHPNIAVTYDFGEIDGRYFLAMEFVEGLTLRQLLERMGPLPVAPALEIARQLASALDYAHGRRGPSGQPEPVVHRDVSPHNVMISVRGHVKLLDFGIAQAEAETRTPGRGAGKLTYAAPEQLAGAACDRRIDLWALGVILFEMLTGAPPWTVSTREEALRATLAGQRTPLGVLRPEATPLEPLVARALAPDADERWSSGQAFLQAAATLEQRFPRPDEATMAGLVAQAGGPDVGVEGVDESFVARVVEPTRTGFASLAPFGEQIEEPSTVLGRAQVSDALDLARTLWAPRREGGLSGAQPPAQLGAAPGGAAAAASVGAPLLVADTEVAPARRADAPPATRLVLDAWGTPRPADPTRGPPSSEPPRSPPAAMGLLDADTRLLPTIQGEDLRAAGPTVYAPLDDGVLDTRVSPSPSDAAAVETEAGPTRAPSAEAAHTLGGLIVERTLPVAARPSLEPRPSRGPWITLALGATTLAAVLIWTGARIFGSEAVEIVAAPPLDQAIAPTAEPQAEAKPVRVEAAPFVVAATASVAAATAEPTADLAPSASGASLAPGAPPAIDVPDDPATVDDPAPARDDRRRRGARPRPAPRGAPSAAKSAAAPSPSPKSAAHAADTVGAPGRISVRTVPWCRVLDGEADLGVTPLVDVPLAAGPHALRFVPGEPSFAAQVVRVDVPAGGRARVFVDFATGKTQVDAH
jgi:serine/threonine-protein kinase